MLNYADSAIAHGATMFNRLEWVEYNEADGNVYLTETGRDIYLTASKGWWSDKYNGVGIFPLYIATGGFGTGRLAVGNVKGLCSDAFGGDGIENDKFGRLCWAPVFSLAAVWDEQFSTFLE